MPQRKELQWSQLRVGALATVALVVLAIGIKDGSRLLIGGEEYAS